MIRNIIGGVIMLLFVVGGAITADALKPGAKRFLPGDAHEAHADETEDGHEPEDKPQKKKKDSHGGGHGGGHGDEGKSASDKNVYYKFSRQFIVPVVNGENLQSLVIMDLNLEMEPGLAEDAYALEPKMRDSLMTELLVLSNEGRFETRLTDPTNYAEIRARLLQASHRVMPEGIHDVLILDIARQDQ